MIPRRDGLELEASQPLERGAGLLAGLVAWWRVLPARMGGTRWVDLVQGRVGTLTGMASPPSASSGWGLGERGPDLRFDSSDDYVACGNAAALMPSRFTIAHGLRPTTLTAANFDSFYAATNASTWAQGYGAYYTSAAPPLPISGASYQFWVEGFNVNFIRLPILLTTWQHYVLTWDAATIRGYYNGREADSLAYSGAMTTGHALEIGRGFSNSFNYDGALDEWMLWDRALSAAEASAVHASWTHGHPHLLARPPDLARPAMAMASSHSGRYFHFFR